MFKIICRHNYSSSCWKHIVE